MTELPDLMTAPSLTLTLDPHDHTKIRVTGGTFVHKERIASVPGSRFVGNGKDYWTIPRTWTAIRVASRLFPGQLVWTPEAAEWANSIWTGLVEPSLALRNEGAKPEWVEAIGKRMPEGFRVLPYQIAGALFLATARRAALFDQQGTGKMTQVALTLSLYPDTLPALIICPKSVLYTWRDELAKFGVASVVADGSAVNRRKVFDEFGHGIVEDDPDRPRVMITSYGLMAKHSRVAGFGTIKLSEEHRTPKELQDTQWACVVADEAHRIKDPTAVQTRACWAVREHAKYVWATTGTPIEKDGIDLWALLHFLDPVEFPSKTKYIDLWIMTAPAYFGGIEILGLRPDTEDEFRSCTEWHWRRVLASEDLPPAVFDKRNAFMEGTHRKAYTDMKKQLMAELDSDGSFDTLFAPNHMVKTGRLKMMASAKCVIDEHDNVRMTEPSWKLDAVMDAMQDYEGKPTIYWFDNRDLLHLFEARLDAHHVGGKPAPIKHVAIHGDVSAEDRATAVRDFQTGEVDHILCTYGAAAEGVTLTRSPVAFRVQRPWSSITDQQAPFRNRRIGSEGHDTITYVDFVTQNTVDEDLITQHLEKIGRQQEILQDAIS